MSAGVLAVAGAIASDPLVAVQTLGYAAVSAPGILEFLGFETAAIAAGVGTAVAPVVLLTSGLYYLSRDSSHPVSVRKSIKIANAIRSPVESMSSPARKKIRDAVSSHQYVTPQRSSVAVPTATPARSPAHFSGRVYQARYRQSSSWLSKGGAKRVGRRRKERRVGRRRGSRFRVYERR